MSGTCWFWQFYYIMLYSTLEFWGFTSDWHPLFQIPNSSPDWGCQGMAPLDFGKSVNPISARGAFYAHHITILSSPDFQTFQRTCGMELRNFYLQRMGESFWVYFIYPLPTTKQQKNKKASKHLSPSLSCSPHGFINFQSRILNFQKSYLLLFDSLNNSWKFRISGNSWNQV